MMYLGCKSRTDITSSCHLTDTGLPSKHRQSSAMGKYTSLGNELTNVAVASNMVYLNSLYPCLEVFKLHHAAVDFPLVAKQI